MPRLGVCLGICLLLVGGWQQLRGETSEAVSEPVSVDVREDFGGRLVREVVRISPVDERSDDRVTLQLDGVAAPGWSAAHPLLDTRLLGDGWHKAILWEHGEDEDEKLAVLNDSRILIHGGAMTADETWAKDRIHVVKHWVRIPVGRTLTIEPKTVVKFCTDTGIRVDGALNAVDVHLLKISDDSRGGDTDMNGWTAGSFGPEKWITGAGSKNVSCLEEDGSVASSQPVRVDVREDFGGRLVRGNAFISPIDERLSPSVRLSLDGASVAAWGPSSPEVDFSGVADGWHDLTLQEAGETEHRSVAVLNSPGTVLHGGCLAADETWKSGQVHLVRHWVRVPARLTLTIEPGAVVKFCTGTGIRVDGVLNGSGAIFTVAGDSTAGAGRDWAAAQGGPLTGGYQVYGNGWIDLSHCAMRFRRDGRWELTLVPGWNLVSVPAGLWGEENASLFKRLRPMVCGRNGYVRGALPVDAGTVLWIYSRVQETVVFRLAEEMVNPHLGGGGASSFVGVSGSRARRIPAESVRAVWEWNGDHYEMKKAESDGCFSLESGRGYLIF